MTENKKNIELPEKLKNNSLAIELSELPNAINEMHELVAKKESELEELRTKIELTEDKIKKTVFFDDSLTNKDKRELKLKEKVSESIDMIELNEKLQKSSKEKSSLDIQLKHLYNNFTAIKYLVRLLELGNQ